jgi:tetratricopeptide (TPR) repeat protein
MNYITSLFFAHYWLGMTSGHDCEFQKGHYHLEKAMEINVAANSVWGISVIKNNQSQWIYNPQGQVSQGYKTSSEAVRLAEESGDKFSKAMSYVSHGFSCFLKRISEEGEEYLLKGSDFCEKINFLFAQVFAEFHLGELYFETEEYEKSKEHYYNAICLMEQSRLLPSWMNLNRIGLSKAMVMNNERDIDLETLYRYEAENKIKLYESSMRRYIGEILLNIDDQHIDEAEAWIKKAIETDETHGMMWYLGKDYTVYAELFKRKGDQLKARENLGKAIGIFKECGSDVWVEKYEKELADLS